MTVCAAADLAFADVPLHGKSMVRFATVEEGTAAITKSDRFIQRLSRFDRQSRMQTSDEVTEKELLDFLGKQVIRWEQDELDKLTVVTDSVHAKLAPFQLPMPDRVLLVKTTGSEEGHAAYCRGNAVVLPRRVLHRTVDQLERLLLHELFHVMSSHHPELRRKLYAIIGFKPCTEIELPGTLKDRKITNPDAPTMDYYIELNLNAAPAAAVPVLFASVDQFDPRQDGSFFRNMRFRMLLIEKKKGRWLPVEKDGRAVVFDPKKIPEYFDKIGRNTSYVIHPDEILADNFVLMVNQADPLPTPRIVTQMKKLLGG